MSIALPRQEIVVQPRFIFHVKQRSMVAREVLKRCVLFTGLNDVELEKIASSVLEKEYDARTTILREGDSADELLVLQEGTVAIQMALPGVEGQTSQWITVDVVGRNDVVGWSAIVEPYRYTFTAVCLQKVKALSISGNKLRWLLRENPKIGYEVLNGLIKVVASRLDDTRQVLVDERLLTGLK